MVVAAELPQTGFQVQVPVEAQRAGAPERAAELIRRRVAQAVGAARGRRDEAVTCGDLLVVQKVGAAVVSDAGPIGTERQLKVRERPGGDDRKHACGGEEQWRSLSLKKGFDVRAFGYLRQETWIQNRDEEEKGRETPRGDEEVGG